MKSKYAQAFGGLLNQIVNNGKYQKNEDMQKRLSKLKEIRDRLCDGDRNDSMRASFNVGTMTMITHWSLLDLLNDILES